MTTLPPIDKPRISTSYYDELDYTTFQMFYPDFAVLFSSVQGFVSYRDTCEGSWFIQELTR